MKPWEEPVRLLPVPLPPIRGEVLGCYLHRLAEANHTTPPLLGQYLSPHSHIYFTRRPDPLRHWTPTALPRLAAMTGVPAETLDRSLPAFARLVARADGTGPTGHAHYDLHVACRHCMKGRRITEPVLTHRDPSTRLCLKHAIWLDGVCHYYVGHLVGLVEAQRQHVRLARRFPDTIDAATKEAAKLTRSWLVAGYQPGLRRRWRERLEDLPHEASRYSSVLRYRYDERESIVTYPEFVSILGIIADPRWRALRIHRKSGIAFERHQETIAAIYIEAERRLSIHTLREMPDARHALRNDPLFRWTDARGRGRFESEEEPHTAP
ncbi:TniQ family protein [Streptomyces sp. NPDC019224]|uniref:TniQ family protein n=1 Tax=Streptomyces sp. NPDC019224 TaxID=3154484 RepID=UPI0033D0D001